MVKKSLLPPLREVHFEHKGIEHVYEVKVGTRATKMSDEEIIAQQKKVIDWFDSKKKKK